MQTNTAAVLAERIVNTIRASSQYWKVGTYALSSGRTVLLDDAISNPLGEIAISDAGDIVAHVGDEAYRRLRDMGLAFPRGA